jgi:AraC-like DNA-binding protein
MYESKMKNFGTELQLPRVNIANYRLIAKPFECWGPRTIPDTELIFIHSGSFALELARQTVRAEAGHLLTIFPGERHCFRNLKESGLISCIHCDVPAGKNPLRLNPVADPEIAEAFRRCGDVFMHPAPHRDELTGTILNELLLRLSGTASPSDGQHPSARVAEMVSYIREHCAEPVTRSVLAKQFHISPQHINHLFKTELGTSPTTLLHLERAKRAFLLIQNDRQSVKEAAEKTGFCDAYHLSKVFKKVYGFPPGRITRFFKPQ